MPSLLSCFNGQSGIVRVGKKCYLLKRLTGVVPKRNQAHQANNCNQPQPDGVLDGGMPVLCWIQSWAGWGYHSSWPQYLAPCPHVCRVCPGRWVGVVLSVPTDAPVERLGSPLGRISQLLVDLAMPKNCHRSGHRLFAAGLVGRSGPGLVHCRCKRWRSNQIRLHIRRPCFLVVFSKFYLVTTC